MLSNAYANGGTLTAQCPGAVRSVKAETKSHLKVLRRNLVSSTFGVCMEAGKASCSKTPQLLGVDRQLLFTHTMVLAADT